MLAESSMRLKDGNALDLVVGNALLESMLIHARSVADFLIRDSSYQSDLRRTDFTDLDWQPAPQDAVVRVSAMIPKIHKQVAHLTWERVDHVKQEWSPTVIAADLVRIADDWLTHFTGRNTELSQHFWLLVVRAKQVLGPDFA